MRDPLYLADKTYRRHEMEETIGVTVLFALAIFFAIKAALSLIGSRRQP